MALDLLFVVDPLDELKAYKDSSVAMMREAAQRGHRIFAATPAKLAATKSAVSAQARRLQMKADDHDWYADLGVQERDLASFSHVLMRKDPPFDVEFLSATLLLSRAAALGARVVNDARALRDHNEKLAILEFPQFTVPTLVTREVDRIRSFWADHEDIVVKPLDGMGGTGVFRLQPGDPNAGSILETVTVRGARTAMAQKFIPAIRDGDKRVLVIDGAPVPYCLARIPKAGETRGNLAAGGTGRAQPLSERDRAIATVVGQALLPRGLRLLGLDVIGDHLTEINVTSPTCFVEITEQTGCNVAGLFIDALERTA
ncbi:MAG TPA: glutathione synthase [Burkholderiaceae bacterium]|nr:glutathione synthase [Burkholderiaceae bacterium]HQR69825.1 glutathione synthase [Burkholderiaceae bacterium]